MSNQKLIREYLQSFYTGNFVEARNLVSDDFHFKGPFIEANSKDAYFSSAARLAPIVRGHNLLRQWEDGNEVCSIYEMKVETPVGAGAVQMSEWHTIRDGKLASGRLIFDTAAFRALVPSR